MFIPQPDPFLLPTYRFSPFQTASIRRNNLISENYQKEAIDYFNERFGENNWTLTLNGREAMSLALKALKLNPNDVTTIKTTSENHYISSCVTTTIEKYTKWNRMQNSKTKAYFVNHEFGYAYQNMEALVANGLPIIEDCCTSFFSQDKMKKMGTYGNFATYSFPKFFSIQIGGLLVSSNPELNTLAALHSKLITAERNYILNVIGFEISNVDELISKRKAVFQYAVQGYQDLGFSLRFKYSDTDTTPYALLLNNNGIIKDLNKHKEYLNKHGIQNSVFYGEDAFFIPCHQNLTETDIDYFKFITENFIKQQ